MHFTTGLIAAALAALPALAQIVSTGTPIVYDSIHNATTIVGSWASGSRNVSTGAVRHYDLPTCAPRLISVQGFANPAQMSFTYPATAGVAYSLCVPLFLCVEGRVG
jgi:hypothetical protein